MSIVRDNIRPSSPFYLQSSQPLCPLVRQDIFSAVQEQQQRAYLDDEDIYVSDLCGRRAQITDERGRVTRNCLQIPCDPEMEPIKDETDEEALGLDELQELRNDPSQQDYLQTPEPHCSSPGLGQRQLERECRCEYIDELTTELEKARKESFRLKQIIASRDAEIEQLKTTLKSLEMLFGVTNLP